MPPPDSDEPPIKAYASADSLNNPQTLRGREHGADVVRIRGRADKLEQVVDREATTGQCELLERHQGALKPPV